MKRIVLFLATNLAVVLVLSVVLKLLGLDRAMYTQTGISYGGLLATAAVVGFGGSIISLLISKPMAKWSTGAHVITQPSTEPSCGAIREGTSAAAHQSGSSSGGGSGGGWGGGR